MIKLNLLLLLFSSVLLSPILTVDPSLPSSPKSDCSDFIRTNCNTTLYPDLCFSTLSPFSNSIHNDSNRLARVAIKLTLSNTLHLASYLKKTYAGYAGGGPHHHRPALGVAGVLKDCFENLKNAVEEMKDSMKQMKELSSSSSGSVQSFRFQMSNVKTWLSAALTDEYTCTDGFENFHEDKSIEDDVCSRVGDVKKLTSNALALVNRYADKAAIP